jgi:PKD repeat protein
MKNSITIYLIILALLIFPLITFGQVIDLGTAENFMLFSCNGAVSNTGASNITGDIGTDLGAISGFGTSTVNGSFHNANAVTAQAKIDVINSYNQLFAIPATVTSHAPAFGSETLTSGVYTVAGAGSLAGNLTLNGLGDTCSLFIFRFGGAFAAGAASSITLINGAQACNVFWVSEGALSLAASTIMKGTVLANNAAVSAASSCNIDGRLLSTTGAIAIGPVTGSIPICLSSCAPLPPPPLLSCCIPDFGGTLNFVAFTSSGAITNAGVSNITGNIGSDLGIISGFGTSTVNGSFYNANPKTAKTKIDLTDLYNQLINYPTTDGSHAPAFGSGETLTSGVYQIAGAGSLAGIVTLDAENDSDAVFVFRFGGAFAAGAASSVVLTNGAQACSVFWVAEGAVSAGAGSIMKGTYLANIGAVGIGANSTLEGRLFSNSGAITFDQINGDNSAPCRLPGCCTITSTWNGSVSTDWFNDSNWDAGTPDSNINAVIPSGKPNMPTISSPNASCKNLDINASASTSLSGSNGIDIYGDWTNNGTFNGNAGTVTLKGFSGNNIISAPNQRLTNLTIDNESVATISSGSIELTGELDIVTGNLNTNNSLTLISDASGTARISEIPFKCKYTLEMYDSWGDDWNGGQITVLVDGISIGDFYCKGAESQHNFYISNGSNLQLQYSSGSFEDENSYTLKDGFGSTLFSDGPNPTTGTNVFSTVSNCSFLNPITGGITMQRHIDAGATNWRFLTSAISGTTLADFNDDFITSGFTGSDFPTFPFTSIQYYDETQPSFQDSGFVAATSTTNPVAIGQGIWVWSGDTITGTQPFTIDITGPPNVGDISLPITYTNSGMPAEDGWNMVGNPYPSTINWDSPSISKSGINNAIYIWNPDLQQYASYVAGFGTNGGSKDIASSQAFRVQAISPGASVILTEASKTSLDGSFLKQNSIAPLKIKSKNSYGNDELLINFNTNASNTFDPLYDAKKIISPNINLPSMSSINSGIDYSINQMNPQEINIPIKILSAISDTHLVSIENVALFNNVSCLILEDLFTGNMYDLSLIDSFSIYISDTTQSARFLLHVGAPIDIEINDISCFGNNDGKIVFNKNSPSTYNISWLDSLNNLLVTNTNVFQTDSLTNLNGGVYFISTTDSFCGNKIDTVFINEPAQITPQFSSSTDTTYLSNGGNVGFNNLSTNAISFLWDFDDLTTSTLVSPTHTFTQIGNYNVTLNAYQHSNCFETISKNIVVLNLTTSISNTNLNEEVKIWINNNILSVKKDKIKAIYIRDVLGKLLFSSKKSTIKQQFNLSHLSSQTLIVIIQSEKSFNSFKINFIKK